MPRHPADLSPRPESHALLSLALYLLGFPAVAGGPPDLDSILERARAVQGEDVEAWRLYRFRRSVLREKMTREGEPKSSEAWEFVITPTVDGFDELIVAIDGEQPTIHDIRAHRKKGRFARHYETARQGEPDEDASAGFTLGLLLYLSTHTYGGREVVDGIPCHRLDFRPPPGDGEKPKGMAARVTAAMEGSLWITEDGFHLYRGEAASIKPVSFYLGLAALRSLVVSMTSQKVEGGHWLPREIRVRTEAHALGVPIRRRNTYRYSDYHLVP